MKQKIAAAVAALAMSAGLLAGCAGNTQEQQVDGAASAAADKIEVVCATFPAYDWARQVVGDQAERYDITYLMEGGVDLHSYQPSVEDMAKIADADLFVYVGGESDEWAEDAVKTAGGDSLHALSMLEAVGDAAVEEEVVEGVEADEHDHEEAPEYDEHVWLSLRNAQVLVDAIASELAAIDPDNASAYEANAQAYNAELSALDARYEQAVSDAAKDTVLFADRFPFRYLVDDYGLSYYAAFVGCSAETEASFETVAFLAQKVDELGLSTVLVIENSDQTIAQTVVANTAAKDQAIAGKFLMRSTFKSFGMENYDECLYVEDPADLKAWCPTAVTSSRGYMLGYYSMDDPAVTGLHRFLARLCDGLVKMQINRFDFAG